MTTQPDLTQPGSPVDVIRILDPNLRFGFAQVPRPVLRARGLSDKAKIVYALLLDYAWQHGSCFPGQKRLADDLHATQRTIQRALNELRGARLVSWKRRGLTQTNLYFILNLAGSPQLALDKADTTEMSYQEPTDLSSLDTTRLSDKEDSSNNTEKNIHYSNLRNVSARRKQLIQTIDSKSGAAPQDGSGAPIESVGDILSRRVGRGRPRQATLSEERQVVSEYIVELGRVLGDTAPTKSSVTRAHRLLQASGLPLGSFIDKLYQARSITQERSASVSRAAAHPTYQIRTKTRMAYFFAVLEDQLKPPAQRRGGGPPDRHARARRGVPTASPRGARR